MQLQTTERAQQLPRGWSPKNALDLWCRAKRGVRDPELLALRMLDHWRDYATFRLASGLDAPWLQFFLEETGASEFALALDRISVSPLYAGSVYRALRANFSGEMFGTVRSSDSNAFSCKRDGPIADIDGLLSHAGADTEVVASVANQSSSGFAGFDNGQAAQRPRIVNSGTLDVTASGCPTMVFDGSNDHLSGPSMGVYGLSGGPALMVATAAQWMATGNYCFSAGRGSNFNAFRLGMAGLSPNTQPIIDINGGSARRTFTGASDATARHCVFTAAMAAGAQVGAAECTQDGQMLSEAAVAGGTNVITINTGTATRWGCVSDSAGNPAGHLNGRSSCLFFFGSVLTNNDLLAIQQEIARHT